MAEGFDSVKSAFLDTPIEELDVSVRTYNCLKRAKISSLGDIINYDKRFDYIKDLGKRTLEEIITVVELKFPAYRYDYSANKFVLVNGLRLVRKGEWEKYQNNMFRCSNCRQTDEVPTAMGIPIYNYCPNCGAQMKGDVEE